MKLPLDRVRRQDTITFGCFLLSAIAVMIAVALDFDLTAYLGVIAMFGAFHARAVSVRVKNELIRAQSLVTAILSTCLIQNVHKETIDFFVSSTLKNKQIQGHLTERERYEAVLLLENALSFDPGPDKEDQ